jgi:hypothetical protein
MLDNFDKLVNKLSISYHYFFKILTLIYIYIKMPTLKTLKELFFIKLLEKR